MTPEELQKEIFEKYETMTNKVGVDVLIGILPISPFAVKSCLTERGKLMRVLKGFHREMHVEVVGVARTVKLVGLSSHDTLMLMKHIAEHHVAKRP